MVAICPTVTAFDAHAYREQMERIESFAPRIHIDMMDGKFAPSTSPELSSIWWADQVMADIHLMYQRPWEQTELLCSLAPHMVIVPAEVMDAEQMVAMSNKLHEHNIAFGVALLAATSAEVIRPYSDVVDHVLIFSGHLGYHGGVADLGLLTKVSDIRRFAQHVEIGWDGGVNDTVAVQLAAGGIGVLNVGGYIQNSDNPASYYQKLVSLLQS
jgi:pentose-5-phosphate-3-epimerase